MKTTKTPALEATEAPPQPAPNPNFAGWRDALEQIRKENGAIAELGARLEQLGADVEKLAGDRKAALADENEETLSRILARREILASRRGKLQAELAEARERAARILGHAQWRFGSLQKLYAQHVFETEKAALNARMVPNCPQLSLEQTVAFLQPVADARALAIQLSQDVEGFIASADKLLAAITGAGFSVPVFEPLSPAGKVETAEPANAAPETLLGPFPDLPGGLSQREIDTEWKRIREENPLLTMAEATRLFSEKFPNLFLTPAEVLQLHAPIGHSTTPEKWRAPMVGDTRPSIPERDQVFETLNS